jgi:hypothetical protein
MLLLPNGEAVDEWLGSTLGANSHVWLLYENGKEYRPEIHVEAVAWFDRNACPVQQNWYGTTLATHYAVVPQASVHSVTARFEDGISLIAATPPEQTLAAGGTFCLRLTWSADVAPQDDYAVFVHVITEEGQLVSQSDRWPPDPSSTWALGQIVETAHGLILPSELRPGKHTINVGLYSLGKGSSGLPAPGK